MGRATALLLALAAVVPARAQEPATLSDLGYAVRTAEAILTSGDGVSLEAFNGPAITGVYLHGAIDGESESVAYGIDGEGKRYSWFAIGRGEIAEGDSVEYVAMLFDVDLDLTPDFLLFRTIDWLAREERSLEYRSFEILDADIDIRSQSACRLPRCDPATWQVRPRRRVEVPSEFFQPWREAWGVAATRGEPWLDKPKSLLLPEEAAAGPDVEVEPPESDAPSGGPVPDDPDAGPVEPEPDAEGAPDGP